MSHNITKVESDCRQELFIPRDSSQVEYYCSGYAAQMMQALRHVGQIAVCDIVTAICLMIIDQVIVRPTSLWQPVEFDICDLALPVDQGVCVNSKARHLSVVGWHTNIVHQECELQQTLSYKPTLCFLFCKKRGIMRNVCYKNGFWSISIRMNALVLRDCQKCIIRPHQMTLDMLNSLHSTSEFRCVALTIDKLWITCFCQ